MGAIGLPGGNGRGQRVVLLRGRQAVLSLDRRGRFRLPDDLAGALHRELGRVQRVAEADAAPAAYERLAFYFVPGTQRRIFLYPTPNIDLAIERFEDPPPGLAPEVIRRARDYFYYRMRFVEADTQNRLVVPEGLRQHADIGEQVHQITLVAHNHWLLLSRSELVEETVAEDSAAFDQAAPEILDPARRTPVESPEILPGSDELNRGEGGPQQ